MTTPAGQMEMEMKQQKGFTLIELVVVIVILGVLAAVALPRFMDATDDAHTSAVQGTGGALAAGVALAHSQWELNRVKGEDATPNIDVAGFGDGEVDVSDIGWPVAGASDVSTAPDAARCVEVWGAVLQGSAPSVDDDTTTSPDYIATANTNGCTYTYRLDGRVAANGASTTDTDAATRTIVYNAATGAVITTAD